MISCSDIGPERRNGSFSRNGSGMDSNRFSIDLAPIALSISRRSAVLLGR
jgi:hypothetical protein